VKLLAAETSGLAASIALMVDGTIVESVALTSQSRRPTQSLVPETGQLLQRHSLSPKDIDVVAVSVGPGSFTGLRVGVAFGKTFAWVNQCRLVAVNTLQTVAQRIGSAAPVVTSVSDAQREELFVEEFRWDASAGIHRSLGETQIVGVNDLVPTGILTGPALVKFGDRFSDQQSLADPTLWSPTAAATAEIGDVMARGEQWSDLDNLEPVYIRRSYAEEKQ
jgi:tRNA threonylcarbamoyladenosine biosynthesis protein TsaB